MVSASYSQVPPCMLLLDVGELGTPGVSRDSESSTSISMMGKWGPVSPAPQLGHQGPFGWESLDPPRTRTFRNFFHHCYSSRFWKGRLSIVMSQRNQPQLQQQFGQEGPGQ